MNNNQLNSFFPIASQTSDIDKFVLLKIMKFKIDESFLRSS